MPATAGSALPLQMLSERRIEVIIAVSVTGLGVLAMFYQFFPGVFTS